MKRQTLFLVIPFALTIFLSGCANLLPSAKQDTEFPWHGFDELKQVFDGIIPYQTTTEDLRQMGFDPFKTPNITILTYLDIIDRFMPKTGMPEKSIDKGIRDCITAKNHCNAYEMKIQRIRKKRFGNVLLDMASFVRKTQETGWKFHAIIVLKNDLVVYKIWGGEPNINRIIDQKKPLGPLQEADEILWKAISF